MKKIVYFLGYSKKKTKIIDFLKKKKNINLKILFNKKLCKNSASKADLIILFGYKKIIKKNIIDLVKNPIINLHISYLPYNRGAHPNFWSHKDKTPSGVSIHQIDDKIDQGNILYRKLVRFRKLDNITLRDSYKILIKEIEKLFIKKFKNILGKKYKIIKITNKGTFHKKEDLPKYVNWNDKIISHINN